MWENVASVPWSFNDQCDETIDGGTTEAGKYSIIYMGLIPGPNKTDEMRENDGNANDASRFHCTLLDA
jgi:hypothetical protein